MQVGGAATGAPRAATIRGGIRSDWMATTEASGSAGATEMDTFFTGLSAKDRSNIEKHLATCDAEARPEHGKLWRRLALALRRLAPLPVQTVGQHSVQFFVPDGKYRMQVFAMEDARDGR